MEEKSEKSLILTVENMVKTFGPVKALGGVSFELKRGQIAGLIGENGSGKSTVTSIVAGMQRADSGEMFLHGADGWKNPWSPATMAEAQKRGVAMILQEANTIPGCTVAENLFAGCLEEFARLGIINMKKMTVAAENILNNFGETGIKAADMLDRYGFEDRKLIEIIRAASEDPEILIIDETTTALSLEGRDMLYSLMKKLIARNKAVIFISHDIEEIIEHCTNVVVLRDGAITGLLDREALNRDDAQKTIRTLMVGRDIGDAYYREDYDASHGEEVELEIQNADFGMLRNFSLTLHRGEIVGIGGLSGCGMHEAGRAAFGLEKIIKGKISRHGKEIVSPQIAIKNGIGYISKNRDTEALILQGPIGDNIELPNIPDISRRGFINPKKSRALVQGEIDRLSIKCTGQRQWVNTLSGGNKQKVSFGKWTAKNCDVFIMDCPTRGVDVGVKQAMYAFIDQMKKDGKAILMVSEELPELIGMADRLLVMKDFAVTKEFTRSKDLKETDVIEYMI
jgi:ribose transport system ATP-binding protein